MSCVAFKQADISRAIKGARVAGLDVGRVEVTKTGTIVLWPKDSVILSDLDRELAEFESSHG